MSIVNTIRFRLEPDRILPQFQRLRWEVIEVSLADVLLRGIHPWMGPNEPPSLEAEFLNRFNGKDAKPEALEGFGLAYDLNQSSVPYMDSRSRFERTLHSIRESVYFVEGLSYVELLEVAKNRLREEWNNATARRLLEKVCFGFPTLRQFLKRKDPRLKLSGYGDLDRYNLGRVLSLEDFAERDSLLIAEGIPTPNFRNARFLERITDGKGRLRLLPELHDFAISAHSTVSGPPVSSVHVVWHVTRSGHTLAFHPDIGGSAPKRTAAREFAERWRTDQGRLVFRTSIQQACEMMAAGVAAPTFPRLSYTQKLAGLPASAELTQSRVDAFHIGGYPTQRLNGAQLRELLRTYGVSMTGTKEDLLEKLSALAARKYAEKEATMDAYFRANRLVLVAKLPPYAERLTVFQDVSKLHNLLLTMYALRHLRGNAILEPDHENATYTVEELALALVTGKVALAGGFLLVA
ncbi:hypothetical protein LDC_1331 [sediment metagenome]|uniref:SAP domain-containing protein n=1 Tax=sediment metagenome TaxID=749907 RepID=D9PIH3_9ZZZZ